jgi:hypothetical protein
MWFSEAFHCFQLILSSFQSFSTSFIWLFFHSFPWLLVSNHSPGLFQLFPLVFPMLSVFQCSFGFRLPNCLLCSLLFPLLSIVGCCFSWSSVSSGFIPFLCSCVFDYFLWFPLALPCFQYVFWCFCGWSFVSVVFHWFPMFFCVVFGFAWSSLCAGFFHGGLACPVIHCCSAGEGSCGMASVAYSTVTVVHSRIQTHRLLVHSRTHAELDLFYSILWHAFVCFHFAFQMCSVISLVFHCCCLHFSCSLEFFRRFPLLSMILIIFNVFLCFSLVVWPVPSRALHLGRGPVPWCGLGTHSTATVVHRRHKSTK